MRRIPADVDAVAAADPSDPPTLYAQLHVASTAPPAVINAAYQTLCRTADADATALTAAYRILHDPRRRVVYDLELRQQLPGEVDTPESRVRTCWRCAEPLPADAKYCSTCHWTRCASCRGLAARTPPGYVRGQSGWSAGRW